MYSDSTERSFAGALVFFLVMALSAYVLLVTALVFWLAELLGSLPLAAVLLGGFTGGFDLIDAHGNTEGRIGLLPDLRVRPIV